jgi:hypothetical protein
MDDDIETEVHRAFESAARDDDREEFIPWNDPRGKRWRRALQSEVTKRTRAKKAAKAAEQELSTVRAECEQRIADMADIVENAQAGYLALQEKYKQLYVEHALLLESRQDETADPASSGESAAPADH